MNPLVCFLTDFGLQDSYVGTMKGVILSAAPETIFVDVTNDVPPQDVRNAAFQLLTCHRYFPKGAIFICVVDPGVGSNRKILLAECGGRFYLAPDNGLLSWTLEQQAPSSVFDISNAVADREISNTFHGRDIFAPVAGRLANGEDPSKIGTPLNEWTCLPFPAVEKMGSRWKGEVLFVDHFGNLITNFRSADVTPNLAASKLWIELGNSKQASTIRGLASSYASVEKGRPLAIAGSAGFIEISVRDGNAQQSTGLKIGDSICLDFKT